jgi:penicillin-binding protein 2
MRAKQLASLAVIIVIVSGCGVFSGGPSSVSSGPTPTLVPDMGKPEGVAQTFLAQWMVGDYAGMYSLLSPKSQKEYTQADFTTTYTSSSDAMTLIDLKAEPISALPDGTGTSAQFAFNVTYNTQVLGPIQESLVMRLVLAEGRWGVVWSPDLIFPEMVGGNSLQLKVESPSRANIYDRNGLGLVTANTSTTTISIVPGEVSAGAEDDMVALLSRVLRMSADQVRANYQGFPADQAWAIGDADTETVQANFAALSSYPGIKFTDKSGRRYFNVLAPHIMGYTSYIPGDQIDVWKKRGYQGSEIVGLAGLELWGEQYLAGTRGGVLSAYTPDGQFFAEIARRDSVPAQSLFTTLDRKTQGDVQDIIQEAYDGGANTWAPTAGGAAVVVLEVKTGKVLAMASYPYYDPNVLNPLNSHPLLTDNTVQELFNNPLKPFLNRATQGQYPPGSVFKIVTTAAALESGVEKPDSVYNCTGVWSGLGPDNLRYDWLKDGHGEITFAQALTASCNPWFYQAGLDTANKNFNLIPDYARQFGFGHTLGLQIEENSGLVPDPAWLQATRGESWTTASSVNLAIGQGDVTVTPLQVAVMIATVANGGTVYRPYFVDHIGLTGDAPTVTFQPEIIGPLAVSQENLAVIRDSMHQVAADPKIGTAEYRLGSLNNVLPIAGKTGTAQVSGTGYPIAWFGGFAPYDNPEIAVVVMVENAGQGSGVAAPIFRRVVERYYGLHELDWPPDWYDPTKFEFVKDIGE